MPADLERYRKAFDNLLACGTSERNNQACANGWIADAGSLVLENEHHVARRALNDYIDNFLRPTAKM